MALYKFDLSDHQLELLQDRVDDTHDAHCHVVHKTVANIERYGSSAMWSAKRDKEMTYVERLNTIRERMIGVVQPSGTRTESTGFSDPVEATSMVNYVLEILKSSNQPEYAAELRRTIKTQAKAMGLSLGHAEGARAALPKAPSQSLQSNDL